MQIYIKATGRLESYLPENTKISGTLSIPQNSTMQDVVHLLNIDTEEAFLCVVNTAMIPQSCLDITAINKDDKIILVPPIKGG